MSENETNREVPSQLGDERGVPSVNKRKKNSKASKIAGIAALVGLLAVMGWMQIRPKAEPEARKEESSQARRSLPDLQMPVSEPPPPPPAAPPAAPAAPAAPAGNPNMGYQQQQPRQPTEAELLLERRKRAPIFAFGNAGGEAAGGGNGNGNAASLEAGAGGSLDGEDGPDRDSLAVNLQGGKFDSARASMLTNRNFLLTAGTMLDCTLVTALESTLPGKTKCQLSRNVYSDNGKVLLLERGSIVEGEY
ncbi:TrbI/VirB10 family protein, partial [Mesorhizobium sp. M7A.T.Ca.US.000.02.2.1]|uniref:TrbI/VirB10 family protein n=1 Tax=Mesorhizobium sp. M7A.T.Ca.US.000.02.2.1 TaxID=2496793 RepID=UPI000FD5CC3C